MRVMMVLVAAMMLAACGPQERQGAVVNSGGGGVPPSTSTPGMPMMDMSPDTDQGPAMSEEETLFTFLDGAEYQGWASPPAPYAADPHGLGRAFLSPELAASLRAGDELHPVGSMAVLERYDPNGELMGWSVMEKVPAGDAEDWYWYETDDLEDPAKFQVSGVGSPMCVACHTNGLDFVQGTYDL